MRVAGSPEPEALHRFDLAAFGKPVAARQNDSQTAETQVRLAPVNRFTARGTRHAAPPGSFA